MRYDPFVELNETAVSKLSQKQKEMLAGICPKKVFAFSKQKNHLEVARGQDCIFCNECKNLAKSLEIEDLVKIEDGDFIFEIESIGSLPPDEIVVSAFQQIDSLLSKFQQDLEAINYSTLH
jgi:ferredoxin-like protein FixX